MLSASGPGVLVHSSGTPHFKTSGPDTFCIYGGPGSELGKFQVGFGGPGLARDDQGWTPRDVTQLPPQWQASTFNSPTGTTAMWAGRTVAQRPGWATAPGYGNGWNYTVEYRATVSDPSMGQIVGLQFVFNYDTEPSFDYFHVEYDSAGIRQRLIRFDGSNKDSSGIFTPVNFPTGNEDRQIVYAGNDYAGPGGDEIVIQFRASSDGFGSDEDGLWPTDGLVQVDDIQVTHLDGIDFEDFEGPESGFLWIPQVPPFAGNYGDIYERITDLDECRENFSPVIGFIDHPDPYFGGTPGAGGSAEYLPRNDVYDGPPTSGTTSTSWTYGLPLGWVLNYSGGVSDGSKSLDNEWWSPEIDWDLPGTDDDDNEIAGVKLHYSVWNHLPLANGIFYQWYVRGHGLGGDWTDWANREIVYYSSNGIGWENWEKVVTDLLPQDRDRVQAKFRVLDLASWFGFPGDDSTIAPCFDNVSVRKYRVGGPVITARTADLFQDSFSSSGGTSIATAQDRDALDIRIDMARDINSGDFGPNEPGDSLIVDVTSVIPGVAISDSLNQIRLHYSLSMNPVFEASLRGNAPVTESGSGRFGWDQHEGVVNASQSYARTGIAVENRYFFDLPDADFMYPGDVLEYYIEAVDDAGNTTTLPADLTGFDDESSPSPARYDRVFTVRGLPSIGQYGFVPQILVWNNDDRDDALVETMLADGFIDGQLNFSEFSFDEYRTLNPSGFGSNGLGSPGAHGATSAQLAGYQIILVDFRDLESGLMSDGSGLLNNQPTDKSDDIGILTSWWNQPDADRGIGHFADNLAADLTDIWSTGPSYLANVLGAQFVADDIRPSIDNQTTPRVIPTGTVPGVQTDFGLLGGCPQLHGFDHVQSIIPSFAMYGFQVSNNPGAYYPDSAAGIYREIGTFNGLRRSAFFPFGFASVSPGNGSPAEDHVDLLCETLYLLGWNPPIFNKARLPCGIGSAVEPGEPPAVRSLELRAARPNPFNPATQLAFTLGRAATGSIKIYNLRGELVRKLADGAFTAGLNELQWRGEDDRGQSVASGVYIVRYDIDGFSRRQKVALVK